MDAVDSGEGSGKGVPAETPTVGPDDTSAGEENEGNKNKKWMEKKTRWRSVVRWTQWILARAAGKECRERNQQHRQQGKEPGDRYTRVALESKKAGATNSSNTTVNVTKATTEIRRRVF